MGYYFDMSAVGIDDYKSMLLNRYLIPSQLVLIEDIEGYFDLLKDQSIPTMAKLYDRLNTKKKIGLLADVTGIPMDYLVVLKRAIGSHIPPARKLADYPTLKADIKVVLLEQGIKDSKKLYEYLYATTYEEVLEALHLELLELKQVASLMDVTRLRYVSPLFATALVEAGYTNVRQIAKADGDILFQAIIKVNDEKHIYKGNIGRKDIQFLVEDAEGYDVEIKYID